MKKIAGVAAAVLLVAVVGIFLINAKKEDTDVTKKQTKVGFVLI